MGRGDKDGADRAATGPSQTIAITAEQLRALVIGLPWHRMGDAATIRIA